MTNWSSSFKGKINSTLKSQCNSSYQQIKRKINMISAEAEKAYGKFNIIND